MAKLFVWTCESGAVTFHAKDEDEAFRKVIAFRMKLTTAAEGFHQGLAATEAEKLEEALHWFHKDDQLVEAKSSEDLEWIDPYKGEIPEK
jgi:hypothetical protein